MRWRARRIGDVRVVVVRAWLPRRTDDGFWVWLSRVRIEKHWVRWIDGRADWVVDSVREVKP